MHPSQETLSAYLDGELTPAEAVRIGRHARECGACAEAIQRFAALERQLGAVAGLACESVRPLLSARHDGELDAALARAAVAHLDACAACQAAEDGWARLDAALAAMPLEAPSARVDAALARFRREPVRSPRRPPFDLLDGLQAPAWLALGRMRPSSAAWAARAIWPARGLAAAAVVVAVLLAVAQQPGAPEVATEPGALVASVQQSVLDTRTGTLYVLHPQEALVAALDASTLGQRAVINVGGKPTALALDEATDQVLVLDSEAKTLTSIDGRTNSVVSSAPLAVPGTPTSIQVNSAGKVVVASVISDFPLAGAPAPTLGTAPQSGAVSVLDPSTQTVQTVSQVDVAPRQVVIDPSGKRALLVSSRGTTIVDAATYKALDRAPGGIAAAFSGRSGDYAILSLKGGGAFVNLSAHAGVALGGTPLAITALPSGGYAVLTASSGQGRITTLGSDGTVGTTLSAPAGRDITYDPLSGDLAVVSATGVSIVSLSGTTAAAAPSSAPSSPLVAIGPALSGVGSGTGTAPSASASPQPTASPSGSASPAPGGSASPAPSGSPSSVAPVAAAPAPSDSGSPSLVPTGARHLSGTTYLYQPSRVSHPVVVAGDGRRIWTLGAANELQSLHTATGDVYDIATLPASARIAQILPGPAHVYLTDPTHGRLYVVDIVTGQLTSYPIPFLALAADAVVSPDDRLWLVADGFGLVSFDPRARRTDVVDVGGTRFSAVGVDAIGRVWLAPRDRQTIDLYDPYSAEFSELLFPHSGSISAILVDEKATVWVGTDTGEVFAMRHRKLTTAGSVGRPIDRLILGPSGEVWYVSRSGGEVTFGPADGSALALHGPAGMSTPAFDALGRAWAEDALSGGFFVTLPGGGR